MNTIIQAAINKKSFELNFYGGTIWCEHLDGMDGYEDKVLEKFNEDKRIFLRPSVSAFMIINLDKTDITENIINTITDTIMESNKIFRKIAFVGVKSLKAKRQLDRIKANGIAVGFIDDYEKAKQWLF